MAPRVDCKTSAFVCDLHPGRGGPPLPPGPRRSVRPVSRRRLAATLCAAFLATLASLHPSWVVAESGRAQVPRDTLLVLGDSLSAEHGLRRGQGWVVLLESRIHKTWRTVNASISGETTRGGRSRIGKLLDRYHPEIVVLELGGNDGLRGLSLARMRENLSAIVRRVQSSGARVLLVGVRIPPNLGPVYTARFHAVYEEVADRFGTALVPFLLAGVGGDPDLMQGDGLHPRAGAEPRVLENVWSALRPMLARR